MSTLQLRLFTPHTSFLPSFLLPRHPSDLLPSFSLFTSLIFSPPQAQVVSTLQLRAQIEPAFTRLIWQKLEEQNPDFFRMYAVRLKLKDQIVMFNYLLEQQVCGG